MSWTLSVNARKAEFLAALERAEPVHKGELHPEAEVQVDALRTFLAAVVPTYEPDDGMVGLYATGGGGTAQGLVSVSLSVASETIPEPAVEVTPDLAEARGAARSRYAAGERPEAPGAVDRRALETQAEVDASDPTREAYQPDREPGQPASAPTSLAEDAKVAAAARKAARPK